MTMQCRSGVALCGAFHGLAIQLPSVGTALGTNLALLEKASAAARSASTCALVRQIFLVICVPVTRSLLQTNSSLATGSLLNITTELSAKPDSA